MERNTIEAPPLDVVQTGQEEEKQPWYSVIDMYDLAIFTAGYVIGLIVANVIWMVIYL